MHQLTHQIKTNTTMKRNGPFIQAARNTLTIHTAQRTQHTVHIPSVALLSSTRTSQTRKYNISAKLFALSPYCFRCLVLFYLCQFLPVSRLFNFLNLLGHVIVPAAVCSCFRSKWLWVFCFVFVCSFCFVFVCSFCFWSSCLISVKERNFQLRFKSYKR